MVETAYNPNLRHMVGPGGIMRPYCSDTSSASMRMTNDLEHVNCPACLELMGYPPVMGPLPNEGDTIEVDIGPPSG